MDPYTFKVYVCIFEFIACVLSACPMRATCVSIASDLYCTKADLILTLITQGWFSQMTFLEGVENSNGSVWPCEGNGFQRVKMASRG